MASRETLTSSDSPGTVPRRLRVIGSIPKESDYALTRCTTVSPNEPSLVLRLITYVKLSEDILPKDVENGVKLEPNLDLRTTTLGQGVNDLLTAKQPRHVLSRHSCMSICT